MVQYDVTEGVIGLKRDGRFIFTNDSVHRAKKLQFQGTIERWNESIEV